MALGRLTARILLVISLLAGALLAVAPPAAADFHLMKVREVFAGGSYASPGAQFIELQMYAAGQNLVGGHSVVVYDAPGAPVATFTFPGNLPNGANQSYILLATPAAQSQFGVAPDLLMGSAPIASSGGAVCFENIDCVSWGTFTGSPPSLPGPPFPGGIPDSQSIDRRISGGSSPTMLDAGDDTNNSAADFQAATPSPTNNAGQSVGAPPPPPGGQAILQGLRTRVKRGRATVSGQIVPPAPGKKVAITFYANGSPLRKIAKKSATLDSQSRFTKRFAVPAESTRCKVKVRFQGQALGQKKFRC